MAPEPKDRFSSAREFRHALADLYAIYKERLSNRQELPPTVKMAAYPGESDGWLQRARNFLGKLFGKKTTQSTAANQATDSIGTGMENVPSLAPQDKSTQDL
jgi:hypothetical protein